MNSLRFWIKIYGIMIIKNDEYKGAWASLRLDKSPWIVLDFG